MEIIKLHVILTFILHLGVWNNYAAALASRELKLSKPKFHREDRSKNQIHRDWFDPVLVQMSKEIASNLQIHTYIHDISRLPPAVISYVCRKISSHNISNRIVTYIKTKKKSEKFKRVQEILIPGTRSTIDLYFVIWRNDLEKLFQTIIDIIFLQNAWTSRSPRPKTLIIVFGCKNYVVTKRSVIHLLNVFWEKLHIFDLAFISVFQNPLYLPLMVKLNYFKGMIYYQDLYKGRSSFNIFFEDTFDMMKHQLSVKTPDLRDLLVRYKKFNNYAYFVLETKVSDLRFVKHFICQVFNCTIRLREFSTDSLLAHLGSFDLFLDDRSVDTLHANPFTKLHFPFKLKPAIPKEESFQPLYEKQELFLFLGFMFVTLVIFIIVAEIFALPLPHWNVINIWQGLLGSSLNVRKNKLAELVLHLTLGIVAFIVSNEMVSMVTNFNFVGQEEVIDSCKKLQRFNVSVYSKYILSDFDQLKECVLDWMDKSQIVSPRGEHNCLFKLSKYNDRICVTTEVFADAMRPRFQFFYEISFKTTDFVLSSGYETIPFAACSQWVNRFNMVIQWCLETGVLPDVTNKYRMRRYSINLHSVVDELSVDSGVIAAALWIILEIGLGVSCIAFVGEKLTLYKRRDRIIKRMMYRCNKRRRY